MAKKLRGTVKKLGLEGGVWALFSEDGQQYQLVGAPKDLCKDGLRAEVEGELPKAMGIAMVGAILKVSSFRPL